MTTLRAAVPRIPLATSAPREVAIVKTVTILVTAAQSHALSRPCFQDVSSIWAEAAWRTCSRSPSTGGSNSAALCRSSLAIMPSAIDRPNRSEAHCWIGRLPKAVGAGQHAEDGPQPQAEGPGGHARRQGGTGRGAAPGTRQAMDPVLID